ncbi:hypothetical protein [Rubritalea tangerina]|uniref:Uncharacterized protein n=1 Tax=Rubritalea tangerina TaxID=430798 RepID=A0ABW4Z8D5_9BACT
MHQVIACPTLPQVSSSLPINHTRQHRNECSEQFYLSCLELAQSLWLSHKPAQAILQLDKAMMATLGPDNPTLTQYPLPYAAILWIVEHSEAEGFIGNPVRHFQHLASRMNWKQPNPRLRIARAWTCFHLIERYFPNRTFTRDLRQIEKEKLVIPTITETLEGIQLFSPHKDEKSLLKELFAKAPGWHGIAKQ